MHLTVDPAILYFGTPVVLVSTTNPDRQGKQVALEVRAVRVHVEAAIRMEGHADRIDPDRWRPLIMSFSQFYGLGERVHRSTLAEIPESMYRPAPRPSAVA